jgi:hypothetical protein
MTRMRSFSLSLPLSLSPSPEEPTDEDGQVCVMVTGSDIFATLGAEHMEDCVAGSADVVADGCEPDHADADHACDADHAVADADKSCHADHALPHASEPVDAHADTTAVQRSLRKRREQRAKVPSDDSEPEESRPKKVSRLTVRARTQPRTNGL